MREKCHIKQSWLCFLFLFFCRTTFGQQSPDLKNLPQEESSSGHLLLSYNFLGDTINTTLYPDTQELKKIQKTHPDSAFIEKHPELYKYFKKYWNDLSKNSGLDASNISENSLNGLQDSIRINQDTLISKGILGVVPDSLEQEKEKELYQSLKESASKRRFTKALYSMLFNDPVDKGSKTKLEKTNITYFQRFQGKTIANIHLKQLEVFGPTLEDTARIETSWVGRAGNRIQTNTKPRIILQNLLFKEGDQLQPNQMVENEKILRDLEFIHDAGIYCTHSLQDTNHIDIHIITKDVFAWGIHVKGSTTKGSVQIFNKNHHGVGNELGLGTVFSSSGDPKFGYTSYYKFTNLWGSFFDAKIFSDYNYKNKNLGFRISRDFFSSTTKYAGGVEYLTSRDAERLFSGDLTDYPFPLNFNKKDFWFGRSFNLTKDQLSAPINLILHTRCIDTRFHNRPEVSNIENKLYHNNTLYLGGISLTKNSYFKNSLIYGFGRTEDIPYGYLFQMMGGYEHGEFQNRNYVGFKMATANIISKYWGYYYGELELGGFVKENIWEQGVFKIQTKYISPLIPWGRSSLRKFVTLFYTRGYERLEGEYITLNEKPHGLTAFNSDEVRGNEKIVVNVESVLFTPTKKLGFQFAYFAFADMGFIGEKNPWKEKYYGFGLGLRLRNDNLVFNAIQIRLAYYPKVPSDFDGFSFQFTSEPRPRFDDFRTSNISPVRFE